MGFCNARRGIGVLTLFLLAAPPALQGEVPALASGDPDAAEALVWDPAIQEFAAGLVVPVKGIAAEDLRNSFDEKRGSRRHDALDIMAPRGTPVLSAADGRVVQLLKNGSGGRMVFATDASERFLLLYAHLDDYAEGLQEGMPLTRGQLLGYVGTSGNAKRDAPHLHFAIKRTVNGLRWRRGTPIDPHPLLLLPPVLASHHENAQQAQQRAAGNDRDHAELETP